MRRIVIPLVFVALLTIASVIPAAASGPQTPDGKDSHSGCDFSG